ncbi:MAG: hypothetical protein JWO89_2415 [Verrucomicrobiaceae bacterium]|nr:hypothetical protein [Verrucomicrobiaceae bacterium]MDB6118022.1 hypothetical protein [Verrucomicrobiaceae bacterium]
MSGEIIEDGKENGSERNLGVQPMDALMIVHEVDNHAIVAASKEPMTHKAVQRARKGRKLTKHMQRRMVTAFNQVLKQKGLEESYSLHRLFNYEA